jgi:hypothetical protein
MRFFFFFLIGSNRLFRLKTPSRGLLIRITSGTLLALVRAETAIRTVTSRSRMIKMFETVVDIRFDSRQTAQRKRFRFRFENQSDVFISMTRKKVTIFVITPRAGSFYSESISASHFDLMVPGHKTISVGLLMSLKASVMTALRTA